MLLDKLFDIFKELKEYIDNEEEEERIISFIAYIMKLTEITPEKLNDILSRISHRGGDVVMTTAMKLREDGILEGFEKGIKKGIEQGIEKGIEEGIFEGKLVTAEALLKEKMSVEKISQITGLPLKDIKKLIKDVQ